MRWWLLVALCGCNQLFDLDATTVAEPLPPPPDLDGDGVADMLDDYWEPTGMWSLLGDSVAPVNPDATLHAPTLELTGEADDSFEVLVGLTQTAPLATGDRFEVQLVDGGGAVLVGCRVRCTPGFGCVLSDLSELSSQQVSANQPLDELAFRRNPIGQYCVYNGGSVSVPAMPFPRVQFRYISVTQ